MDTDYDLIVLGAGNAGVTAASAAAASGWRVAIVEGRALGGTCPLRGCVPKKVLVAAAESLDIIAGAKAHGIHTAPATLDWAELIERKEGFIEGVPEDFRSMLTKRGIDVVEGRARFVGSTSIEANDRRLNARRVVVATGSRPRPLPFPGSELLKTSDDILTMRQRPRNLAFVGAGVIAFELGHVLARAGTAVVMLEAAPKPLTTFDPELVDKLAEHTRGLGVELHTGVEVESVDPQGDGFLVHYREDDQVRTLEVDAVVNGAGRVPDYDGLGLEQAGIELTRGRPRVDAYLRSQDNPAVYFAGDALPGSPQLSPVASYEGRIVGHNLLEEAPRAADYSWIPAAVHTIPTLATVGRTEAAAREEGLDVEVRAHDLRQWRSARTYAEKTAYSKIVLDRGSGGIVGAHLLGHGAAETIHAFALAIRHGLNAQDLREMVYAYPTFHADIPHQL